ncbi:hypothetical protein KI387_025904, partial [Taxus chinensis]
MKKLDPLHAKQRFCLHAFSQPSPPEGFEDFVQKMLNICNGLPLSIKIFGEQLYDNSSKDYWESQLHKLDSGLLPNRIKERLKQSYDTLDEQEKNIFLHTKKTSIGEIKPTTAGSLREIVEFPSCWGNLLPYSAGAEKIGVNNGLMGDNLPPQDEVVTLMQNNNIGKLRIYIADPHVLEAVANSGIEIIIGVANFELRDISSNQEVANMWVDENIIPYYPATNIKYIVVGNQAFEKTKYGLYVLSAMNNIQIALEKANLQHRIKVSTTHGRAVIPMSLLPSKGTFNNRVKNKMRSVLQFLDDHGSPYMANIYRYFAYLENPNISIDYALFKSTAPTVIDGD